MERVPIHMACGAYDRMEALVTGAVQAEGVALTLHPPDHLECDIREMPLFMYLAHKAQGARQIAIPVFPLRRFCHDRVFVSARAGVERPQDLVGKCVGFTAEEAEACPWICGLLQREHGIEADSFRLLATAPEELAAKLAGGEIDAAFGCHLRTAAGARPLFPDAASLDRESWRKNGIFPILTVLVMPESLHAQHPWLAESLFKACEEAKHWCIRQMRFSGALRYMLPWLLDEIDAMDDLFGADPWPYGVQANRPTLDEAVRLLRTQGRIDGKVDIEQMFTPIVAWAE